tara:strand:- start:2591 stop:3631 length:1041 start_codon:yes stop_codon:yes gene_type:complete
MKDVVKHPNWKNITFRTTKLNFLDWAIKHGGINIKISDKSYKFESQQELEALRYSINPTMNLGSDTCYISPDEMKSVHVKSKERMEKIELLNGKVWDKDELIKKMYSDSFYYGELGKYALSSSAIKQLIDSPKSYQRSLNFKSDTGAFKIGRLIHLAALEPEKLDTLCHVVEVQSAVTKKFKDKVSEVGSAQFVFTRKEYDKAMYTADALLQNDVWQQLTRGAKFEVPGFDILNGFPFRAKADVLGFDYIADLKTTSDIKGFKWAAKKFGYDVQVYIYCNLFKVDYKDFKFFVIDKGSGDLGIYDVKESFYNSGKDKVEYGLKIFQNYFIDRTEEINEYVVTGTLE